MTPAVAVAVVSWNTAAHLDACLASLRADHDAGRAEVWVVDNGSSDGSAALVAERHPWARLLALDVNAGFGGAVALVAARTATPWVAAANADVALEPEALVALLDAGEAHPEAGALAPRLVTADGGTQHSVHPFPTVATGLLLSSGLAGWGPVARRLPLEGHWDAEVAREVDWAHGAFLLVRRAAWDAVGGFDPAQWLWAEDLDLSWRLRRAGWRTRYVPGARVGHAVSAAMAARWSPQERALGAQRSAYAWLIARRGRTVARAVALAHLAGPAARAPAYAALARLRPEPWAARAARQRAWRAQHLTGLEPRARLAAHRRGEAERTGGPRLGVLLDHVPELTETFVTAELHELLARGVNLHVEAAAPAPTPDLAAGAGLTFRFATDDDPATRRRALWWLWRHAPAACLRDLAGRRRWRREEWPVPLRVLAPAARRLDGAGAEHLHAHFGAGAALSALRLGRLLDLPTSLALHGYDIFQSPRNLGEKLDRAAFATSGSRFTVDHLRAAHPRAADRIHLQVMGVDPAAWTRTQPTPTRGTVVAVGRLVEKKGFAHLVAAVEQLRHAPGFERLVIVGDGPGRLELEALVARLGVGAVVELRGALPPAEVRALLEGAAVVAVPSVVAADGDTDSMPLSAKEALAMEVPVVAFEVAGLPEVVRPPWGVTVPAGDVPALAAALAAVLALPPDERAEMGAAGRRHVAETMSVAAGTAMLLTLVDGEVAERRRTPLGFRRASGSGRARR